MNIRVILSCLLLSAAITGCVNSKKVSEIVYDKYNGKDGFSILVLPPNFVDKFVSSDETNQKELLKTVSDFRLMFFDEVVEGKDQSAIREEIKQLLDKRNFEDYLSINKDGSDISIKAIVKDNIIRDLFVIIGGEKKLVVASLSGRINGQNLKKTIDEIDLNDFGEIENFSGDFDFEDFKFIF
jgi:hypothetical protein